MTLRVIATVLLVVVAMGTIAAWRPAPAVSSALIAGLVSAIVAYGFVRPDGPRGVPADVAMGFSVGIVVGGGLGLVVGRRRESGERPMRRDALWLLVATPFAAAALLQAIQDACPLYVTRGSGLCYYDFDLMGGWAAGVVFLFVVDMLIVSALLWLGSWGDAPAGAHRGTGSRQPSFLIIDRADSEGE